MASIERCAEFLPRGHHARVPPRTRGIYVLFKEQPKGRYDVVYVGLAGGLKAGMRGRLGSHSRWKAKKAWSHFSVFKTWDNIPEQNIRELERLLRHVYRKDGRISLNIQKGFKPLKRLAKDRDWLLSAKQRGRHPAR
jgi:hypothetical protein